MFASFSKSGHFFKTVTEGDSTLTLAGDIFSAGAVTFEGPNDSRLVPLLWKHLVSENKSPWDVLSGQFSIVIQNPDSIKAYRSPFSPYQVFFTAKGISDNLRTFMSAEVQFSSDYFRSFVLDRPGVQFTSSLTPLEGVFRLRPHSSVIITQDRKPQETLHSFEPFDWVPEKPSLQEVSTGLRAQLETVLKWHLQKAPEVGAELSGGLDSSFVASYLADLNKSPIRAHMYSYRKHPSHAFSEHCAQKVATDKAINLTIVDSATVEITDISKLLPYQDEPIDFYWQGALFGPICQKLTPDKSLLFTGFGCDQILMRNQSILGHFFHRAGFLKTLPLVKTIARSLDRPILNFYFQFVLSLLPERLLSKIMDWTRNLRLNPFKIDELAPHLSRNDRVRWIKKGKAFSEPEELLNLQRAGEQESRRFFSSCIPSPNLNYLTAPHYVLGPYLEPKAVYYIHPFCDPRVIEFSLRQIPTLVIHDFATPYKNILREAQKEITPEEVRLRKKDEFSFDGYYYSFLKRNEAYLSQLIEEIIQENLEWIDATELRQSFQAMLFGLFSNSEVKLARLISYFIWKKNFLAHTSRR